MGYKYIAFDIDGTLLGSQTCMLTALQETLPVKWKGCALAQSERVHALGIPGLETLRRYGLEDPQAAVEHWGKRMKQHAYTITNHPGVEKLIRCLPICSAPAPIRKSCCTLATACTTVSVPMVQIWILPWLYEVPAICISRQSSPPNARMTFLHVCKKAQRLSAELFQFW